MDWWDNLWMDSADTAASSGGDTGGSWWDSIIGGSTGAPSTNTPSTGGSSWWDTATNWLGNNKGIIGGSIGLYDAYQKGQARNDIVNQMEAAERQKWEEGKAAYDAYLANINAQNAASAANANAAAAAKQNAFNFLQGQQGNILSDLQPYLKAGKKSVKQMGKNYKKGSNTANMLLQYLMKPENMKLMDDHTSAQDVAVKLPEWMKK